MNIDSGDTPLVLLCPAWKRWGTATTVKPNTVILHSPADETIPFADSQELLHNSGLAESALIVVGTDLQLADPEPLKAMLEAVERVSQTKTTDSPLPTKPAPNRITRWLLIAVGIYSFLLVSFLNLVILNSDKARDRAIFLMADGMILLWIIVGGSLTPMLRRWLVPRIATIPIDWRVRFVLFCTPPSGWRVPARHRRKSRTVGDLSLAPRYDPSAPRTCSRRAPDFLSVTQLDISTS
jgi:hypothetical protein